MIESAWIDSMSAPSALCTSLWRASGTLPWNCLLTTEISKLVPQLWRTGGRRQLGRTDRREEDGFVLGKSRGSRDVTLAKTYSPLMSVTSTSVASSALRRSSSISCTDGMMFPRLWRVWHSVKVSSGFSFLKKKVRENIRQTWSRRALGEARRGNPR